MIYSHRSSQWNGTVTMKDGPVNNVLLSIKAMDNNIISIFG